MKRGGQLKRRTPLKVKGNSETADIKQEIQDTLLAIVKARDGGCVFRVLLGHQCSGYAPKSGHLVLQADHMVTRSNSATFADSRLVVCVCKGIHGWKSVGSNRNKAQYDEMLKRILPPDRVALWERCERDSWRPVRTGIYDWKLALIALKQELRQLRESA